MPADATPTPGRPDRAAVALAVGPAAVAALVGGAAALGRWPLVAVVVAVQVAMAVAWLVVIGVPAAAAAIAIVTAAAIATDVIVVRDDALTKVAGVIAASFVAALLMQLARRRRRRVTTSLAGVMSGVVVVVLTSYLLATHAGEGEWPAAVLVAAAVGAALLVGRLLDLLASPSWGVVARGWRRSAVPLVGSRRGWPGLLVGLAVAAGIGAWFGGQQDPLTTGSGVLIALAAALVAQLIDVAVAVSSAELADGGRLLAVRVLAVVLPLAAAAPAGYAVTSIAVG